MELIGKIIWIAFKLALTLVVVLPLVGLGVCVMADKFHGIGIAFLGIASLGLALFIFVYAMFPSRSSEPTHATLYEGSVILLSIRDRHGKELHWQGIGCKLVGDALEVEVQHASEKKIMWVPRKHLQIVEADLIARQIPAFAGVEAQYFAQWTVENIEDSTQRGNS